MARAAGPGGGTRTDAGRRLADVARAAASGSGLPVGLAIFLVLGLAAGVVAASALIPGPSPATGSVVGTSPSPEAVPPIGDAVAIAPAAQGGRRVARLPGLGPTTPDGPAPPGPRAHLSVPSVGLSVAVVGYGDCSGATPMTRSAAVHDTCTPAAVTALVGHNPGVFTPLLNTHPGDAVAYRNENGVDQAYRLQGSPQRMTPYDAAVATQDSSYRHMVLTTCAAPDSSSYWVFTAVPESAGATAGSGGAAGGSGGGPPPPHPSPTPSQASLLGGLGL